MADKCCTAKGVSALCRRRENRANMINSPCQNGPQYRRDNAAGAHTERQGGAGRAEFTLGRRASQRIPDAFRLEKCGSGFLQRMPLSKTRPDSPVAAAPDACPRLATRPPRALVVAGATVVVVPKEVDAHEVAPGETQRCFSFRALPSARLKWSAASQPSRYGGVFSCAGNRQRLTIC